MTDKLQQHVHKTLSARADSFSAADAASRLQRIDYRPRSGRRPRARIVAASSTALVTLAAVAVIVILSASGTGSGPRLISHAGGINTGWTPVPEDLSPSRFTEIKRQVYRSWKQRCGRGTGSIVLADVRGPYTFTLYATAASTNGGSVTWCDNDGSDGGDTSPQRAWPPPVAADRPSVAGSGLTWLPRPRLSSGLPGAKSSGGFYAYLQFDRAGNGVKSVTIVLNTGRKVDATVAGGWYLAWWPARAGYSERMIVTASHVPKGENSATYTLPDFDAMRISGPLETRMLREAIAAERRRQVH